MQRAPGDTINSLSLAFLLFLAVIEVELYTITRDLINTCGRMAWLAVLLGGLGSMAALYYLILLARKFPGQTFFEYTPQVWGKTLSYGIILLFTSLWLLWLSRVLWHVGNINQTFFLPNTPVIVVLAIFVSGTILLASYGLVPITRFFELMLFFFIIPYIFIMVISLTNIKLHHFFPLFEKGVWPVVLGSLHYMLGLQGLEIILFALPFTKRPEKSLAPTMTALAVIHIVAVVQVIGVIGNVGITRASKLIYPSMDMLSTLRVPGWPVERFEPLLTIPWIIGTFTTAALLIYLISYGLTILFKRLPAGYFCWLSGLAGILLICIYPNILWVLLMDEAGMCLTALLAYGIPLLTLVLSHLRKKGARIG